MGHIAHLIHIGQYFPCKHMQNYFKFLYCGPNRSGNMTLTIWLCIGSSFKYKFELLWVRGFLKRFWLTDWFIIYRFTSRIFHLYGDITITSEGLQNLDICSALRAFFIMPHLLWHGPSVFRPHPKDRPIQSPLTTHEGMWRIYSTLDPHGGKRFWKIFPTEIDVNMLYPIVVPPDPLGPWFE
jgi:hypothetical protein